MSTTPAYGPYDPGKHGQFNAKSAAAVAEGVPGWPPPEVMAEYRKTTAHLHQHTGGHPECTFPGCPQGTLHPGYYEGYYDDEAVS